MMAELEVRYISYRMAVRTDDQGRLLCPCCDEPMVEVMQGEFRCSLYDAIGAAVAKAATGEAPD